MLNTKTRTTTQEVKQSFFALDVLSGKRPIPDYNRYTEEKKALDNLGLTQEEYRREIDGIAERCGL